MSFALSANENEVICCFFFLMFPPFCQLSWTWHRDPTLDIVRLLYKLLIAVASLLTSAAVKSKESYIPKGRELEIWNWIITYIFLVLNHPWSVLKICKIVLKIKFTHYKSYEYIPLWENYHQSCQLVFMWNCMSCQELGFIKSNSRRWLESENSRRSERKRL
jgi:hypothetical protein